MLQRRRDLLEKIRLGEDSFLELRHQAARPTTPWSESKPR